MSGLGSPSTPSNDEGESRDISNDKEGLLDDPNIVAGERQPTGEDKVKVEEHVQHQSATNKDSESTWENYFSRLLIFREQNGHCMVPSRYSNDPPLGVWVSTQRRLYRQWQSSQTYNDKLTKDRIQRLELVGFKWSPQEMRHVPWEVRYQELADFVRKYGHAQIPIGWEENVKLANWVSTQRQEYKLLLKGRSSRLTQSRIEQLNRINFVWEAQRGGPRRKLSASVAVPNRPNPIPQMMQFHGAPINNSIRPSHFGQLGLPFISQPLSNSINPTFGNIANLNMSIPSSQPILYQQGSLPQQANSPYQAEAQVGVASLDQSAYYEMKPSASLAPLAPVPPSPAPTNVLVPQMAQWGHDVASATSIESIFDACQNDGGMEKNNDVQTTSSSGNRNGFSNGAQPSSNNDHEQLSGIYRDFG